MPQNTIIAFESSCDDTSVAILQDAKLLSMVVSSQEIHKNYGGVVPELASRAHLQHLVPLVESAFQKASISKHEIDAVAFTQGPGLLGSLLVGISYAKAMALVEDIPMIAVDHMEAHVLAHMIEDPKPSFPYLCLTVSGGHTQISIVQSPLDIKVVGKTLDDAAGEAFDKTGKLLGLTYPAGPIIDKRAQNGAHQFTFPHPNISELNFSFSGLKTSIRNFVHTNISSDKDFVTNHIDDICCSVQNTIVDILLKKLEKAAIRYGIHEIAIAGGVSANSTLRKRFQALCKEKGWQSYIPRFAYCTDNAAMIAIAAHYKLQANIFVDQRTVAKPKLYKHKS